MPELPEVETVRRSLLPHLLGRTIERVKVREHRFRWPIEKQRLKQAVEGHRIIDIRRRAKYLLFYLEPASEFMVHLGMSGRLGVYDAHLPLQVHDHVIWTLQGGRQMRFNDPRRFGCVVPLAPGSESTDPRLRHLGMEPLAAAFTGSWLYAHTRGSKKPIKNWLMDSTRLVGVGNIYASEALFVAGIHPNAPAGRLTKARCDKLVGAIQKTLTDAIAQGGTTLRDFADGNGDAGYFAIRLQVYGREGQPCPRCGEPVRRLVQAGRSTFSCRRCQR